MQSTGEGPYERASYIPKLQKTRTMVLTDLDGTMTDGGEPTERELSDRASVRELLNTAGVVAGAVTARTCGLTLSHDALFSSRELLLHEPPPRWVVENGRHVYMDLSRIAYFRHSLNWHLVGSFGGYIIVENGNGYRVDHEYADLLRHDYSRVREKAGVVEAINEEPWRLAMLSFVLEKCPWVNEHMAPIESRLNYERREVDVGPLEFRFQLNFVGTTGLEAMQHLKALIEEERTAGNPLALRIALVDESRVDEKDPEKSRYTLYLVPWGARKEKMIHRIFTQSVGAAGIEPKDARLFYAGDTLTDLRAGLWAGGDAKLAFLLPKGSRLAPYLIERRSSYGTHDLSFLWENPRKKGRTKARLVPTGRKGEYEFVHKIRGERKNLVVIADERYPREQTAPGSVAAFLDEYLVSNEHRP